MSLMEWLDNQKVSDWVQGLGSLTAAAAAVGIALRQERLERQRAQAAASLRAQILAAAIVPILQGMQTAVRLRSSLLQSVRRIRDPAELPKVEELVTPLPDIFLNTIDRIDVFGARVAAQIYTLIHRVNDYNRHVHDCRDWDVPHQAWETNLRPKLDAVIEVVDFLLPRLTRLTEAMDEAP
jgi:hypothetical protein